MMMLVQMVCIFGLLPMLCMVAACLIGLLMAATHPDGPNKLKVKQFCISGGASALLVAGMALWGAWGEWRAAFTNWLSLIWGGAHLIGGVAVAFNGLREKFHDGKY